MDPVQWKDGKLKFLDQTKLPFQETYYETDDPKEIALAIQRLAIRGAPLIGIAAAYAVVLAAKKISISLNVKDYLDNTIQMLRMTRPTAINLFWALGRQKRIIDNWDKKSLSHLYEQLLSEAINIHHEEVVRCEKISAYGTELLPDNCVLITHCNTGSLATGGSGTALGIIKRTWELGKLTHVYINETRPLLQGARLTAWELRKNNIPSTLIVDSASAYLMKNYKIDAVIVGADRITRNGDVANKIGTYNLAILSNYHKIPFYVAAPVSTIDCNIVDGKEVPIEQRAREEVIKISDLAIAIEDTEVLNPAFDVTPNELITAIITDVGVFYKPFSQPIEKTLIKQ